MTGLSEVHQRLLALGLLALLVGSLGLWLNAAIGTYATSIGNEQSRRSALLGRDRNILAQGAAIQAADVAVRNSVLWLQLYKAQPVDKTLLEIQGDLRVLLSEAAGSTPAFSALPPSVEHSLLRAGVRVSLSTPIDRLAAALDRLEHHERYLKVENLSIQAPDFRVPDSNPAVLIQADVFGYMPTSIGKQSCSIGESCVR